VPAGVKADAKRRELVAQAAALFDRAGYHTTSVAAVAQAAGIRKPTLYHYFASKDEILFAIHDEFIDLLIERERARPADLPAADAVREAMRDVLELMDTHRGHVRAFFEHYRELSEEARATIARKRDEYEAAVERRIAQGIERGEFRPVDPRLTALAVFGMCNWAYQWYRREGRLSSREIADRFFDLLLNGLRR